MKPLARSLIFFACINTSFYGLANLMANSERANFALVMMSLFDILAILASSSKDILNDLRLISRAQAISSIAIVAFVSLLPLGNASIPERVIGAAIGLNFFLFLLIWFANIRAKQTRLSEDESGRN